MPSSSKSYAPAVPSCCSAMKRAREEGTEAEGKGAAVYWDDDNSHRIAGQQSRPSGEFIIGALLDQPIRYCPWCGHKISQRDKRSRPVTAADYNSKKG